MPSRPSGTSIAPHGTPAPGEVAREGVAASLRARSWHGWSALAGVAFFTLALWALHVAL
jgi:hypothetical protein